VDVGPCHPGIGLMIMISKLGESKKRDVKICFKTEDRIFDEVNPSGSLKEYKDSEVSESFKIYISRGIKKNKVLGVLRLKFEFKGAMFEDVSVRIDEPSIYLSRIGVEKSQRHTSLGSILMNFLNILSKESFGETLRGDRFLYI
jgi:hypothetical protein